MIGEEAFGTICTLSPRTLTIARSHCCRVPCKTTQSNVLWYLHLHPCRATSNGGSSALLDPAFSILTDPQGVLDGVIELGLLPEPFFRSLAEILWRPLGFCMFIEVFLRSGAYSHSQAAYQ